jgi:hypothetical protein
LKGALVVRSGSFFSKRLYAMKEDIIPRVGIPLPGSERVF